MNVQKKISINSFKCFKLDFVYNLRNWKIMSYKLYFFTYHNGLFK